MAQKKTFDFTCGDEQRSKPKSGNVFFPKTKSHSHLKTPKKKKKKRKGGVGGLLR
jgi:hypothetical protein